MRRGLIFALFLLPISLLAQKRDSSSKSDSTFHDPTVATVRSAILPGLGQVYNEKYWKVPIVYGGLGASVYFIVRNGRRYRDYRSALVARANGKSDPYQGIYNEQQLTVLKKTYRRWRDLSYMSFLAVYLLQVVDANVDAHLHDFDVSDDLSLRMEPWTNGPPLPSDPMKGGVGLSLRIGF